MVGVLTVFVLIEKIGPTGVRLARTGGAIMIALGVIMVSTGCSQAARPRAAPAIPASEAYVAPESGDATCAASGSSPSAATTPRRIIHPMASG
jgi:hypothetical protein